MSLLDAGIKILKNMKYEFSDEPFMIGMRFENYVLDLFSRDYFSIVEKTHSAETNQKRYIESSVNPDFVFRYTPSGEMFAVECKFRSRLNVEGLLSWSYPDQMKRYQEFSNTRKIPVFIVIGLGGIDNDPENLFNIPLEDAKYPSLYPSVFNKFRRPSDKPFFWKDGVLF